MVKLFDFYPFIEKLQLGATKRQLVDGYMRVFDRDIPVGIDDIEYLEELGDKRAIEPMLGYRGLGSPLQGNRRAARKALDKLGATKEQLVKGYGPAVRGRHAYDEALDFLIESGDENAIDPLLGALHGGSKEYRQKVWEGLRNLGATKEQLVDGCLDVLGNYQNAKREARTDAVKFLEELGDKRAINPLLGCLNDTESKEHRQIVRKVLDKLGATKRQLVEGYVRALVHSRFEWYINEEVHEEALRSLGELGDKRAIGAIFQSLAYPSPKKEIAREALNRLGVPNEQIAQGASLRDEALREAMSNVPIYNRLFEETRFFLGGGEGGGP